MEPDSWIQLNDGTGFYRIPMDQWDYIEAAFGHWIERGIDKMLILTDISGADVRVPASKVMDFFTDTPEVRKRGLVWEKAYKAECEYAP